MANRYKIKLVDIPDTDNRILYEYFVSVQEALKTIQSALDDIDMRLSKIKA